MNNRTKIILLFLLAFMFACGLRFWANDSPTVGDDSSSGLDPEIELAFDFSVALQYNSAGAYEMIDPSIEPQLNKWMSAHQSKECENPYDVSLIETGTNQGSKTTLGCHGNNGWISFEVDDIVIKDMKVIDWGEVREED